MAKVQAEVLYSDKGQKKVEKGVETLQQKMEGFAKNNFQLALVGGAILGMASQLTAAAKAAYDFAKAGAATSGVSKEFNELDAAINQSKLRLQESTARMMVNSGAMEAVGGAVGHLGNTFNILESIISNLGPVLKMIEFTMWGLNLPLMAISELLNLVGDGFSWLGDALGLPSIELGEITADFEWLGDILKTSVEPIDTFADSFQRMNDILEKGQLAGKIKDVSSNIKNMFSDKATQKQIDYIADTLFVLADSGNSVADNQEILSERIKAVSGNMKEYEDNILRVAAAIQEKSKKDIETAKTGELAATALEGLAAAAKNTYFEFSKNKPLVDFNIIGGSIADTILAGSNKLGQFLGAAQKHKDTLKSYNKEIIALSESTNIYLGIVGISLNQLNAIPTAAERLWKKAEDAFDAYAEKITVRNEKLTEMLVKSSAAGFGASKNEINKANEAWVNGWVKKGVKELEILSENQKKTSKFTLEGMKEQISLSAPLANSIMGTIGHIAEVGWFNAGLQAAIETGYGIATIFTAPWESATHFAAAAQFIVAQAMAGSKGGSKGGGAAASGKTTLGGSQNLQRQSVTRETQDQNIVIEVDGQRLGSITTNQINKNSKNGQYLNSETVKKGGRRGVLS